MQDKEGQRPAQAVQPSSKTISSLRSAAKEFASARQAHTEDDSDKKASSEHLKIGAWWLRILWNMSTVVVVSIYISTFSKYDSKATLFPRLVGYPILLLSLASLVLEITQLIQRRPKRSSQSQREQISLVNLFTALVFGVIYLFLWTPLGFELDSVVLMVVAPIVLGYPVRRIAILAIVGFLTAGLFTYLFGLGSGAILPIGYFNIRWP